MAGQMLMKAADQDPKLTTEQKIRSYFLNRKLSDVRFLVGDQREEFSAHRFLLAASSEVFGAMFYRGFTETSNEIEVPDLSPVGFRNMLK